MTFSPGIFYNQDIGTAIIGLGLKCAFNSQLQDRHKILNRIADIRKAFKLKLHDNGKMSERLILGFQSIGLHAHI